MGAVHEQRRTAAACSAACCAQGRDQNAEPLTKSPDCYRQIRKKHPSANFTHSRPLVFVSQEAVPVERHTRSVVQDDFWQSPGDREPDGAGMAFQFYNTIP